MEYTWENMFRPHILERGYEYYIMGSVLELGQFGSDDTFYEARVEGSTEYHVTIQFYNGMVSDMECDCPYALDGNNCKHMAAVLYEIEEKRETPFVDRCEEIVSSESLIEVLRRASEEDLRAFLLELSTEDERIKNRVFLKFSASVDKVQLGNLMQELEAISNDCSDRSGYINWERASDYESAIIEFLEDNTKILLGRNCVLEAFELIGKTIFRVGEQELDDSFGTMTGIASFAHQCLSDVVAASGQAEKGEIFDWFKARIKNNDAPEYAEDMISAFFDEEFHEEEFLLKKLQLFDNEDMLPAEDDWRARYRYNNNIIRCLNIMDELDFPEPQLQEYIQKHWERSEVRKAAAKRAVRKGNIEKAIRILQESKDLDQQYAGLVAEYSQELIRLFERIGNKKEYRKELEFQIFSCRQSDFLYISMLKTHCEKDEWEIYRERILTSPSCSSIRYSLMETEGMLERLMQEIVQANSVHLLDRYENSLKGSFPDQLRDAYVTYVNCNAATVSNRKEYNHLVRYLKKIRKYPGGCEIAADIAKSWRIFYYRRSAMMDELSKAGF